MTNGPYRILTGQEENKKQFTGQFFARQSRNSKIMQNFKNTITNLFKVDTFILKNLGFYELINYLGSVKMVLLSLSVYINTDWFAHNFFIFHVSHMFLKTTYYVVLGLSFTLSLLFP